MPAPSLFQPEKSRPHAKELLHLLGNRLLAGLVLSVPLIVTIMVMQVAYKTIHGITAPACLLRRPRKR